MSGYTVAVFFHAVGVSMDPTVARYGKWPYGHSSR
jgi:hypothetical protein